MPARKTSEGFSAEEKAAMRERVRELRSAAKSASGDGEAEVRAKIAELPPRDRAIAQRFHELVRATAPSLTPRTWYGMPAYAKAGHVLCFFQASGKFKTRYSTIGFSDESQLDEGQLWPVVFAVTTLTPAVEKRLVELLVRAVG